MTGIANEHRNLTSNFIFREHVIHLIEILNVGEYSVCPAHLGETIL